MAFRKGEIEVLDISREHPDYIATKAMRKKHGDLYAGGEQLKARAMEYLTRRVKEPIDVYMERLEKVFYENYIGSIIDWYAATLFRREPVVTFEGSNERGRKFFSEFDEDCDLRGTSLTNFYRKQLVEALVHGVSYTVIDFPRGAAGATNRLEEELSGASRAYLVGFSADDVINWSRDERGNFEWVVIRTEHVRKNRLEDLEWTRETRWTYYDKERFRTYRRAEGAESVIERVAEGPHGLSKYGQVPLFETRVSDGQWLMNKAALLQLEHFNRSNSLSWALTMGLYAMPVVYSDKDWNQVVGESYYIQLGQNDRFGWTEPEGKVFEIAAANLSRLQEEIYRVCHLMMQARSADSIAGQSGLSKQRDFAVTQEVLRGYGDVMKDSMKRVLRAIGEAREDDLVIDVSGLDEFDIGDFSSDLEDAKSLLALGVESPTLRKQILKKLVGKYLCDARQEVKDRIAGEIDGA
jgi:hypothetical protein